MAPPKGQKKTASTASKAPTRKVVPKSKPPPIDKFIGPAVGVGLALMGYYFFRGLKEEIARIDVNDELVLREVFFGEGEGKNYVVLCHGDDTAKPRPISSVFSDARNDRQPPRNTEFVLADCEHVLPSGKSIAERFSLDLKSKPTVFISGKVGSPKQVPEANLKSGPILMKMLRLMLEPHAAKIEDTKDLKSKCLNKDVCALLLKGGKPEKYVKDAVSNLMDKYPDVQLASIDSVNLLLSNLEEFLPEFVKGKHRFVLFKKVSGGLDAGTGNESDKASGRLITSIAPLDSEGLSFAAMDSLIGGALDGSKTVRKLPALPVVKVRTKKADEAERAKRQRTQDRANRQKQQAEGGSSSQTFEANDGSKEGRRLEREKRREEHRQQQGNYRERTPEEIAEMERRRRQRMEEEAAKWNMASEDAPDEGEPVTEEEYSLDELYEGNEDEDISEEDEEEVMDLD